MTTFPEDNPATPEPSPEIPFTESGHLTDDQIDQLSEIVDRPSTEFQPTPKRARKKVAPVANAVVGGGETDPVVFSRAVPLAEARTRKSLTVHHLQRRLAELGHVEAASDIDGRYGDLTTRSVEQWQAKNGHPVTGRLTREEFGAIFEGDPNVTVDYT